MEITKTEIANMLKDLPILKEELEKAHAEAKDLGVADRFSQIVMPELKKASRWVSRMKSRH